MRAVDTNVLVRLVARDDAAQTVSAESFIARGAWVSVLALAEATCVLSSAYQRTAAEIARAIQMLLEHEDLILQDSEAVALALELFRARPSLSFSDCMVLELARKAGHVPLGTFDRAFGKVDGTLRL